MAAPDSRDARLVREFTQDSLEMLGDFQLGMLKLAGGGSQPGVVDHLFRMIHSVKGNAGFFGGFQAVRRVAHALEDVLDGVRRAGGACPPGAQPLLQRGSELLARALRAQLDGVAPSATAGAEEDAFCAEVRDHRSQPPALAAGPTVAGNGPGASTIRSAAESGATIKIEAASLAALGREIAAVRAGLEELAGVAPSVNVLQDRMTALAHLLADLRTVTLHKLFDKLPAMVGSLAETLGKSVAVQTEGGDLRVDRALVEVLDGALVHLIRNALDHGIERQDIRARRGKPAVGRLVVRACRPAGDRPGLQLQVEDDGAGIDPKRMRMEAVVRKLMTEQEAAGLSDDDAIALVFRPGFSTAPTTTDVSGRGVGMDAVMTSIRNAGGQVQIQSTPRRSTVILLDLPGSDVTATAQSTMSATTPAGTTAGGATPGQP
jgi:two-component system, chemotaxis family, sensor kinase CheA